MKFLSLSRIGEVNAVLMREKNLGKPETEELQNGKNNYMGFIFATDVKFRMKKKTVLALL